MSYNEFPPRKLLLLLCVLSVVGVFDVEANSGSAVLPVSAAVLTT